MPSPFPGMDPYLEHPLHWPVLRQYLAGQIADDLAEVLPRRYQARLADRVYLEELDHDLYPSGPPRSIVCALPRPTRAPSNGSAMIAPRWHLPLAPEEERESRVEIVPATPEGAPVTIIELLGLANKTPGMAGRREYRAAQRQALERGAHLLEIDLLRGGEHTVTAPLPRLLRRGRFDGLVCLSRADSREFCEAWPVLLHQPLPRVAVPLAGEDADLALDLQAVFGRVYEAAGFGRLVNYQDDPWRPLTPAQAAWAKSFLKAPIIQGEAR